VDAEQAIKVQADLHNATTISAHITFQLQIE
jgi:hypothetical protein